MRLIAAITLVASALLGCSACGRGAVTFEGVSMMPSIRDGDRLWLARFDRGAEFDVRRGDILLFRFPRDPSVLYIKRLVGLPGELVEVRGGRVFVDGAELAEPYVAPELNTMRDAAEPVRVPEGHYYVLGDNRDNSSDSRLWGPLPGGHVLGKVLNR